MNWPEPAYGTRRNARLAAEQAQKDGADDIVQYPPGLLSSSEAITVGRELKKVIGGNGADIVFDPVGGALAESALRATAWQGRYLVVGFAAGIPATPWNLVLLKGCSIIGVLMNEFARRSPETAAANIKRLFDLHQSGKLAPAISAYYSFDNAREALAAVHNRQAIGKLVVRINDRTK